MNSISLIQPELQYNLEKNGFVKIQFWDEATVQNVKAYYETHFMHSHVSSKHFHTTYETANPKLINDVNAFLQPLFLSETKNILKNMSPISASFLIKQAHQDSSTPLHQDASFVDEPKYCSISIWVALEDVDEKNGCLQFIPGSHHLFTAKRSLPYDNKHIEPFSSQLMPLLTKFKLKAGEAFVFYNAVLHTSAPNRTTKDRIAVVMGFYSNGATLSLYVANHDKKTTQRYAISTEQLNTINAVFKPLEEQLIETEPIENNITEMDVNLFIERQSILKRWAKKAKAFFSMI